MTTPDTTQPSEHPSELLLSYLDNELPAQDKAGIRNHLQSCSECARELDQLHHLTHLLRTNKDAFCPEPWELFQYVEIAVDSEGRMSAHLARCSMCREEVAEHSSCVGDTTMPKQLMAEMRRQFPERSSETDVREETRPLTGLVDQIKGLFSIPVMALGTVAALVLVVVMLLPTKESPLVIGLSSVEWKTGRPELIPKTAIRLMGPVKQSRSVATVLLLKDVQFTVAQQQIDSIYRALKPTDAMERHFLMLHPGRIKEALEAATRKPLDSREIMEILRDRMGVSDVLLITVSTKGKGFEVTNELLDARTGLLIRQTSIGPLTEPNLASGIQESAFSLLKTLEKAN